MSTSFLDDLAQRGLVHQVSSPAAAEALRTGPVTGYIGFDPTADSLHVGSLLQIMTLRRLQLAGHRPIALVGGTTGLIGDPSGKSAERAMLSAEQLERNAAGIRRQLEGLLDFSGGRALLVNNEEWLGRLTLVDFLRDVGKHFSVNQMMARDSVRTRLETRDSGISFTEFTYMLLQAYDFLALYDRHQCTFQLGGSDQWGNILSGIDFVRRMRGVEVYGVTSPLVMKADGGKFGKTEEGNVWLDPSRTSPYAFYQFWLNADDRDVVTYLNYYTLLPAEQIGELARGVQQSPERREAQRVLAEEVTRWVHGEGGLARARRATEILFSKSGDFRSLSAEELEEAFRGAPHSTLARSALGTERAGLLAVLAETGLYPSRGQARKDLPNGSVSVNHEAVVDAGRVLAATDVLAGEFIILRKGRKHYHVLRVVDG